MNRDVIILCKEVFFSPDHKFRHLAIKIELVSHEESNTWTFIQRPANQNLSTST